MASRRDDEAGPFGSEHLERRDLAHAHAEAGVGDLDLLRGVGDDLMGRHHVVAPMRAEDWSAPPAGLEPATHGLGNRRSIL